MATGNLRDSVSRFLPIESCEESKRTGTGRTHDDHADVLGNRAAAALSVLELLDALLEARDDVLKTLELVVDDTHFSGWRSAVRARGSGDGCGEVEEEVFDAKLIDRSWRKQARDRGGVGICERWSEEEVIEVQNETAKNKQE